MESNRGKRSTDFTRTYTVDSGKVSPASSTSSVASENAGRLVFDTFEVAAHNINELMQLIAMWEAEESAKSEAEGEPLGPLYVNQKVEKYLHKFFNRRKVFAEHFIGGDMCPEEEDVPLKDASSEYFEEQLRKYMEDKDSSTPASGFFSCMPLEHTALTSVFTGNDLTGAATDPLSEIEEKEDLDSFRSTESYPTSEDYREVDSTSQTIIATTSSMSSRGSSQQAVHTDVHSAPSSPFGSTPEPTGEQGYLTPLQASLLAIKTAYFVETVSTTQSRSFLSVEDTSSLASCESTEEQYLDVESEDTDSNLSTLVDTDAVSENVIQEVEKDKQYTDMYTRGATALSPAIVQTNIDSSSSFLTPEDLTMRIQSSQIPQAISFNEDDDVSFQLPKSQESTDETLEATMLAPSLLSSSAQQAVCSAAVEEYVADMNIIQGIASYLPSEDTSLAMREYQFPQERSVTEKEADPQSKEKDDTSQAVYAQTSVFLPKSEESLDITSQAMMVSPPMPSSSSSESVQSYILLDLPKSEESMDITQPTTMVSAPMPSSTSSLSVQSNILLGLPKSEESPDTTPQTMTVAPPMPGSGSSRQAESPDVAPVLSFSSTLEASGRQTPLTALQMSLFAVKVASSIELSNQACSFLSAEDESPIFLPGPTEEPEPSVVSEDVLCSVADIDVLPDNIITEAKDNLFPDISTRADVETKGPDEVQEQYLATDMYMTKEEETVIAEVVGTSYTHLTSQLPQLASSLIDEKEASTASSEKEAASLGATVLTDSIQNFVPMELPEIDKSKDSPPQTPTVPPSLSSYSLIEQPQHPEATSTLRGQVFSQTPQAASLSEIFQTVSIHNVPMEQAKSEQSEDSTPQTSRVPPSLSIQRPEATSTLRGQDFSQIPQASGQQGPSTALLSYSDSSEKPEQATFTEEDLSAELERFRKQYGMVPKEDSSDFMTEEVSSDLLIVGVSSDLVADGESSDLVVEEDSSSLLTEADSSSFAAEVVSSELLAEEDTSSQVIREDSSGLVVEEESYSLVSEEDLPGMLTVDDLPGLVADVDLPGLLADDDSYGLLAEEDSYGLVAEEDSYGLVTDDDSYGVVAEDNTYGLVAEDDSYGLVAEEDLSGALAEDDSYGLLAEEDLYGLVAEEQSAGVAAEAYSPGVVAAQDSYGLLTEEDSYGLLAEEDSYEVVLEEASGVRVTEDSYTISAEEDSYDLLTEEDSSGLLLQEDSYGVLAGEDSSPLVANVDTSCLIAKGESPAPLVGETSDRVALSFSSSDSAQQAERLEMAPALMEKSIDVAPGSQKLEMVPVLGRVIKVMECIYAATEAPYFAGYIVKNRKKDP